MRLSSASQATSSLSLPCSLPSTPVFPPLVDSPPQTESERERKHLLSYTEDTEDIADVKSQEKETAAPTTTGAPPKQQGQHQVKQDVAMQGKTLQAEHEGHSAETRRRRGMATVRLATEVPSILLRPLDQEEEKKALLLEQQFTMERMAALRRQNALRRRRHKEKQQQMHAAAVRQRAAALERRHRKLQAARVLMERGKAAAATSAAVHSSAAVKQNGAASPVTAIAPECSTSFSASTVTSTGVSLAPPELCCNATCSAATDSLFQPDPPASSTYMTSDSLGQDQAKWKQALFMGAKNRMVHQVPAAHRLSPGYTPKSNVEALVSVKGATAAPIKPNIPIHTDAISRPVMTRTAGAEASCFPDASGLADCVVAGAGVQCGANICAAGSNQHAAAGGYLRQATQEIFSLWPYERRTLLNASLNKGEQVLLLQKHNVNHLILTTSVTSQQTAREAHGNSYSSSAVACGSTLMGDSIALQQASTDCKSLPLRRAYKTSSNLYNSSVEGNVQALPQLFASQPAEPATGSREKGRSRRQRNGTAATSSQVAMTHSQSQEQRHHQPKQRKSQQQQDAFLVHCRAEQQVDTSEGKVKGTALQIVSASANTSASAATDTEEPAVCEHQSVRLQDQQQHDEHHHPQSRQERQMQQQRNAVAQSRARTEKKSYAGQFASVRAKVGKVRQGARSTSRDAKKPGFSSLQENDAANLLAEALAKTAPSAASAAKISVSPAATVSPSVFSAPVALPAARVVPTPSGQPAAAASSSYPDIAAAKSFTLAARSATISAELLQAPDFNGHVEESEAPRHFACRSLTHATMAKSGTPSRVSELQRQRSQLGIQSSAQATPHTHNAPNHPRNGQSNATAVQVVDRKLKALIEEQLQHTVLGSASAVLRTSQVAPSTAVAKNFFSNALDVHTCGKPDFAESLLAPLKAAGAAERAPTTADTVLHNIPAGALGGVSLQRIGDDERSGAHMETRLLDAASTVKQQQHQAKQRFCEQQQEAKVDRQQGERLQRQRQSQQPATKQHQSTITTDYADCAQDATNSLGRTCEERLHQKRLNTTAENARSEIAVDCTACKSVCRQIVSYSGATMSNAKETCEQHDEDKYRTPHLAKNESSCTTKEQKEHTLLPQRGSCAHQVKKAKNFTDQLDTGRNCEPSAEDKFSSVKQTKEGSCGAEHPSYCRSPQPRTRNGKEHDRKEESLVGYACSLSNKLVRIVRVREAAGTDVAEPPGEEAEPPSSPYDPPERFKNLPSESRHILHMQKMPCDLPAGEAACKDDVETDIDEPEDHEGKEGRIRQQSERQERGTRGIRPDPASEVTSFTLGIREEASSRERSCQPLSCKASRIPSTCASSGHASATMAISREHCAACTGCCNGSVVLPTASRNARSVQEVECGNSSWATCAPGRHCRPTTCCTSGNPSPFSATGSPSSNGECFRRYTCSSTKCCVACESFVTCKLRSQCGSESPRKRHRQRRRHERKITGSSAHPLLGSQLETRDNVVPPSSVYALQENARRHSSPTSSRGWYPARLVCTCMGHTCHQMQPLEPRSETQEVNGQWHSDTSPVSTPQHGSSCVVSARQRHQQQQQQRKYFYGNTKAENETSQNMRRLTPCSKNLSDRATASLKACANVGESTSRMRSVVASKVSSSTPRTLTTFGSNSGSNKSLPYANEVGINKCGAPDRCSNSRSSVDNCNSSNRCKKCSGDFQVYEPDTVCQRRQKRYSLTPGKDQSCGCRFPSLPTPAAPDSCSRQLRRRSCTSSSRTKVDPILGESYDSSTGVCWSSLGAGMSNCSSTTCDGFCEDSLDSSVSCHSGLSRGPSGTLTACAPPFGTTRLRNSAAISTKRAAPKRSAVKGLKLQALANAEKKVEGRLLLLDVNQKTLDEQHERKKYLKQQLLQQQQQQLLEQQQQLLALVQNRSFPHDANCNSCSTPCKGKKNCGGVSTATTHCRYVGSPTQRIIGCSSLMQQGASTNYIPHSMEVLDRSQCATDCNTSGTRLWSPAPGTNQVAAPVNGVLSAIPPIMSFTASPFNAVTVSLPANSEARGLVVTSSPASGSLPPATASMTRTTLLQGGLSSTTKDDYKLSSSALCARQPLPPLKAAKIANSLPPLQRKGRGAAGGASEAASTMKEADAGAAGDSGGCALLQMPTLHTASFKKSVKPAKRVAASHALPPLPTWSSFRTARQQPLEFRPRVV